MLPRGLLREYFSIIALLVKSMDLAFIILAGWLAYYFKFGQLYMGPSYFLALMSSLGIAFFVFPFFQLYDSIRSNTPGAYMWRVVQAVFILALLLAGLGFITKSGETYSRLWFINWLALLLLFLLISRIGLLFCLRFMRSQGLNERRVVILGVGELGIKLAETVQQALWTGFRIVALLDDNSQNKPSALLNLPVIQTPADLSRYLTAENIDEIWLALPLRAEARVKEIMHELRHHTITTRFVLDIFGLDLLNHSITDVAGFPVLNIRSTPMVGANRLIKAIEDRLLAAVILFIISPLFLLIALGVKWSSPGPVFFRQRRLGWDGRIINIYKFRTMFEHEEAAGKLTQATQQDKRVTRFGKFLRRTSLDELPQFINVLQGRMSIVGPRPHALEHNELYKDSIYTYMQRHHVKPGITGWAQINGWRGETDTLDKMQKRVDYDLYYINNWSLGFDLKIIFLTFFRGFISRNAY